MFRFLRVDKTFLPDVSAKRNVSGIPKNKALDGLLDLLRRNSRVKRSLKQHLPLKLWLRISGSVDTIRNRNLVKPQPLGPEVRQQLIEIYRDDILELQKLIGRDLSGWLK
jgi:hypothetical protein